MRTVQSRFIVLPAIALGCLVATAGCSSQKVVDRGQLESGVKSKLEAAAHAKAKSVTCPDKLKAKVHATTRCTLVATDGSKIGVTVTVTAVHGSDVSYHAQADQKPMQ
ncbi:MAG: DUF4333 domain-containing protein [Mycobacterium sp.]|nr:DUF4333 domain-containing protein [Mycobacterium sp.]